jgi:YD repeat-containing protein
LLETETDENGKVTRSYYNHNGDLARVVMPTGLTTTYKYNGIGRQVERDEHCTDCPNAAVLVTTTSYNGLSQPLVITEPASDDSAYGGTVHQAQTTNTYDADGNLHQVDVADVGHGAPADATRTTVHDFDANDREMHTNEAGKGDTYRTFDSVGNVISTTDPAGIVTTTDFDALNRPSATHILNYQDDPGVPGVAGTAPRTLTTLSNITYDALGDKTGFTDALGIRTTISYDAMGHHTGTIVINWDGAGHNFKLDSEVVDELGHITVQRSNGDQTVTNNSYDAMGRLVQTVEDPAGAHRITTLTLDGLGHVLSKVVTNSGGAEQAATDFTYDAGGQVLTQAVHNGTTNLTTTYTYDQRGNRNDDRPA